MQQANETNGSVLHSDLQKYGEIVTHKTSHERIALTFIVIFELNRFQCLSNNISDAIFVMFFNGFNIFLFPDYL